MNSRFIVAVSFRTRLTFHNQKIIRFCALSFLRNRSSNMDGYGFTFLFLFDSSGRAVFPPFLSQSMSRSQISFFFLKRFLIQRMIDLKEQHSNAKQDRFGVGRIVPLLRKYSFHFSLALAICPSASRTSLSALNYRAPHNIILRRIVE